MANKRDNGTGTIYQRENGTWMGKIFIGKTPEGTSKYKCFSGKTQTEVKRKIKEYNQSNDKTNIVKATVEQYLDKRNAH